MRAIIAKSFKDRRTGRIYHRGELISITTCRYFDIIDNIGQEYVSLVPLESSIDVDTEGDVPTG